ncbi:MAG: hypothetical protein ACHQ2Z_03910 [Elusimicrobiota bacterium]
MKNIIFAFLLALGAGTAQGAIVYLKEGGRLEGALVSSTGAEVVLDTAQGRVRIDMDRVRDIDNTQGGTSAAAPAAAPPPEEYRVLRRRRAESAAQSEDGRQRLSVDFGLAAPLSAAAFAGTAGGGSANNGVTGPGFGLQYLYNTSPRFGWGLEYDYYQRNVSESASLLPLSNAFVFGDTSLLFGVMKVALADRGPVRPFVLLGAGAYLNSLTINAHPQQGYAWSDTQTGETRTLVDDTALGLAATVRVGLDFGFYDPSVFSLEAGWTGMTSADYQATAQGRALGITGVSGPLNYFMFNGRWGFSF